MFGSLSPSLPLSLESTSREDSNKTPQNKDHHLGSPLGTRRDGGGSSGGSGVRSIEGKLQSRCVPWVGPTRSGRLSAGHLGREEEAWAAEAGNRGPLRMKGGMPVLQCVQILNLVVDLKLMLCPLYLSF